MGGGGGFKTQEEEPNGVVGGCIGGASMREHKSLANVKGCSRGSPKKKKLKKPKE